MDYLAVLATMVGTSFVLAWMGFKLDSEKHYPLQIICIFFAVFILLMAGKGTTDVNQDCQTVLNYTHLANIIDLPSPATDTVNATEYHYAVFCSNYTGRPLPMSGTPYQFYWLLTVFVIIIEAYLSVQFIKYLLDKLGGLVK